MHNAGLPFQLGIKGVSNSHCELLIFFISFSLGRLVCSYKIVVEHFRNSSWDRTRVWASLFRRAALSYDINQKKYKAILQTPSEVYIIVHSKPTLKLYYRQNFVQFHEKVASSFSFWGFTTKKKKKSIVFHAHPYTLECEIHPKMRSWEEFFYPRKYFNSFFRASRMSGIQNKDLCFLETVNF